MPTNTAAWIDAARAELVVRAAPYTAPGEHQLVVRNRAVAVNPLDSIKQSTGDLTYRWLPYPFVLGEDLAGEVVEVGPGVTRFAVGDRVLAYAVGMEKQHANAAEGAFQLHTVVREDLTSAIPDDMPFERAAVLPLALSTAASALFGADQLALARPQPAPEATGQAVLVWGGASSVGANAVQLAVAAGYDVVATASAHNRDFVLGLGARAVLDRHSDDVTREVLAALDGTPLAGTLSVGTGSAALCADIVAAAAGRKRISMTSPPVPLDGLPPGTFDPQRWRTLARLVGSTAALQVRCRARGIRAGFVWGSALMTTDLGAAIFRDHLPAALADGRHLAVPEPLVVGDGLDKVQPAIDALRAGVSARKLVVTL
jgi:NADPH:quinone reductase-like Zn-dependent oxidoreductase